MNGKQPEVIVRGRHLDLGEFWVDHVKEKTAALDRFGINILRFDVEVSHETNPRQSSKAWLVEISAIVLPIFWIDVTESRVASCISATCEEISSVAFAV